jgi:Tol biopolymer transport system component
LRVAFSARVDTNLDIWVRDAKSGADSRVSFEADEEGRPTWFPDGQRVAYRVLTGGFNMQFVAREVGGASERKDLVSGLGGQFSRDGRYLAYFVDERGRTRLRYATIGANGEFSRPVPLFKSSPEPDAGGPTFSPDGRFIAYVERQPSGNMEVFVTRFPSGEGRLQISAGGGRAPLWAANGELFYLAGTTEGPKQMMAARIEPVDTLRASIPLKLFDIGEELDANYTLPNFDVAKDGKQFLMVRRTARGGPATRWVLVQNWPAEFNRVRQVR